MNKVLLTIAAAAALFALASCGGTETTKAKEKKPLYYANPMDPSVKSDVPMKDPMGMDYIAVYADGDQPASEAPAGVAISEEAAKRIDVRTVPVEFKPFGLSLKAVGRVAYDERAWVHMSARFGGRVEKLYADYAGVSVEAGKPVMSIYSPAVVAAQQELLQLRRRGASLDDPVFAAAREKLRLWGLSDAQVDGILAEGKPLYAVPVLSPISGTVISKSPVAGMYVNEGEMLFEVADLSTVWAEIDVYEQDAGRVKLGDEVEMSSVANPGVVFAGKVSFIAPALDPATRTVKIRAEVDNRRGLLKPNMYVEAVVKNKDAAKKLVVPATALLDTGARKIVYVDLGNGRYAGRRVVVEAVSSGEIAIKSGLAEGENVVAAGAFLIDSQAQLLGVKDIAGEEDGTE